MIMINDFNKIFNKAIDKAKTDQQFANDLASYAKYLALKFCPKDRLPELEIIFKDGTIKDFFDFASKIVPDFGEKILKYAGEY